MTENNKTSWRLLIFSSYKDHTIFILDPRQRTVCVTLVIKTYSKKFPRETEKLKEPLFHAAV